MSDLIYVGTYMLGLHNIRLYGDPTDLGGHVTLRTEDKGPAQVIVGFEDSSWSYTLGILLHELYEATLIDLGSRYVARPAYTDSSSNFMFFVNHEQLDEAHSRVASLLGKALPDFQKAHRKFHKQKNKNEKIDRPTVKTKANK